MKKKARKTKTIAETLCDTECREIESSLGELQKSIEEISAEIGFVEKIEKGGKKPRAAAKKKK